MNDCIFCKIISGDIPSDKVYENAHTYAFLDINPTNKGHVLVVPKNHSRNTLDIAAEDFKTLMETVHLLAPKVKEATHAEGINIITNNEKASGQEVFHTHIHIVPRFEDDGHQWWSHTSYKEGEAQEVADKIKGTL